MGKITKNYLYNVSYQILVLLAPIVTAPYLARILGASNLGIYSYVSSSGNIITTLSLIGIYNYGNRQTAYVRDNFEILTSTFWELFFIKIGLGTIGTVAYFVYVYANKEYFTFFLIYYPFIFAQFIDCSWFYVGLENIKLAVIKNFIMKLGTIIGIFVFVKSRDDLWIYIMLIALSTLGANLSIYVQLPHYIGKPKLDIQMIPQHIKGSIVLFLPQVASLFYLQVDKVMLKWITGETQQVSFYDQAEKIVTIPLSLIIAISSVVMPRIANEYKKNNKEAVQTILIKAGKYALCIAMPMMMGIFCIARQFIPWYLGEEFYSASNAIMILTPIILLNSLAGISGRQYFTATNQLTILVKAYSIAAIMNVISNALLIPHFGYIGTAIATVLSSLYSVIVQYYYLAKQINIEKLWRYGIKYFIGAFIMAVCIFLFTSKMEASIITTFEQIFIGVIIYALYLLFTKDSVIKDVLKIFH